MNGPLASAVLADRELLYFFRSEGCPACAVALPELYRFMARHPALTVLVLDAGGPYPGQLGVKLRATPTYLFRHGEQGETHVGTMKSTDIEKWIRKIGGSL